MRYLGKIGNELWFFDDNTGKLVTDSVSFAEERKTLYAKIAGLENELSVADASIKDLEEENDMLYEVLTEFEDIHNKSQRVLDDYYHKLANGLTN